MMCTVRSYITTTCCLIFSFIAISNLCLAGEIVFQDTEFPDSIWSAEIIHYEGSYPKVEAYQVSVGGNPGAYRETRHYYYGSIYVFHEFSGATVDPAAIGGIDSLDYAVDYTKIDNGWSGNCSMRPALSQNGVYYYGPGLNNFSQFYWLTFNESGLTSEDFLLYPGQSGPSHPDFSESGSVIQFGYQTANSGGAPAEFIQGEDNLQYKIHYTNNIYVDPESFIIRTFKDSISVDQLIISNMGTTAHGYRLSSDVGWISFSSDSGVIASQSADTLDVMFNATGFDPDIYSSMIIVETTDPFLPQDSVPVTMIVFPYVTIEMTPNSTTLHRGDTLSYDIVITNNSNLMFNFEFSTVVILPNETIYGPLIGPITALLLPYGTITGDIEHVIPGFTPYWTYTYVSKAVMPLDMVVGRGEFDFDVVPGAYSLIYHEEDFKTIKVVLDGKDYLNQ